MKFFPHVAIVILLLQASHAAGQASAQQTSPTKKSFEIALPADVPSEQVQVAVKLSGAFGATYSVKHAPAGVREFTLDTTVKDQPATALDAVVFAPGCQTVTLSIPALARSSRKAAFACRPLAPVVLRGKVQPSESLRGREYEVEIDERAHWVMDFFGVQDGPVPTFRVASVIPDDDGAFTAEIPDLLHDAGARSFDVNAAFDFTAREKGGGNILASLQPVDAGGSPYELLPQPSYPDEILLQPIR